jgi:SAM-dependent methyltransferase
VNRSHIEFLSSPRWAEMLETDLLPWVLTVGDLGDDVLEIGPGPGLTTDLLRRRAERITAVEVDAALAGQLAKRLAGTNVEIINCDATRTTLGSDRFSAATCFSMLHHMANPPDQDRLFSEVARLLRPGGIFVGVDSLDLEPIRQNHEGDTFTPVPPATLPERMEAAGLTDVRLDEDVYQIRFVARKPVSSVVADD